LRLPFHGPVHHFPAHVRIRSIFPFPDPPFASKPPLSFFSEFAAPASLFLRPVSGTPLSRQGRAGRFPPHRALFFFCPSLNFVFPAALAARKAIPRCTLPPLHVFHFQDSLPQLSSKCTQFLVYPRSGFSPSPDRADRDHSRSEFFSPFLAFFSESQ